MKRTLFCLFFFAFLSLPGKAQRDKAIYERYCTAVKEKAALQTGDLTGTWYEIGLGANLGIAKNSNLYFDALKTFGGDLRTDWQFNAGLRFTF